MELGIKKIWFSILEAWNKNTAIIVAVIMKLLNKVVSNVVYIWYKYSPKEGFRGKVKIACKVIKLGLILYVVFSYTKDFVTCAVHILKVVLIVYLIFMIIKLFI